MTWAAKDTVAANAARLLPALAAAYFDAGADLFAAETTPERLHTFRLKTKHFRYTLELFEEQYGVRFGALQKRLKPVQDALGEINDAATALAWLGADDSPTAKEWLTERIARKSKRFERHWTTVFDKPGARERWMRVLATPKNSKRSPQGKLHAAPAVKQAAFVGDHQ